MIKQNKSTAPNVKVIDDGQLNQVLGGHRGGHGRRNYGHCYKNRGYNDYNRSSGYEDKSYGCGYENKGYGEDRYGSDYSDDES